MDDEYLLAESLGITIDELRQAKQAEQVMYQTRIQPSSPVNPPSRRSIPNLPTYPSNDETIFGFKKATQLFLDSHAIVSADESLNKLSAGIDFIPVSAPEKLKRDAERVHYTLAAVTGYENINQILTDISEETRKGYHEVVANWNKQPVGKLLTQILFGGDHFEMRPVARWLRHPIIFYPEKAKHWMLLQLIGGPCGVIAVLQAYLLSSLLYSTHGTTDRQLTVLDKLTNTSPICVRQHLSQTLARIIWQTRRKEKAVQLAWLEPIATNFIEGSISELNRRGGHPVDGFARDLSSNLIVYLKQFTDLRELIQYIYDNLLVLFCGPRVAGCLNLVLSCIYTRGLDTINTEDMSSMGLCDFTGLITEFGHCSQEMLNLLICGRAVGNVFDGVKNVDDLALLGIPDRAPIGYLTEMEALQYTFVGNFLKTPLTPSWVIGRSNHFTSLYLLTPHTFKLTVADLVEEFCDKLWREVDSDNGGVTVGTVFKQRILKEQLALEDSIVEGALRTMVSDDVVTQSSFVEWMRHNYLKVSKFLSEYLDPLTQYRLSKDGGGDLGSTAGSNVYLYVDGQITNISDCIDKRGVQPKPTAVWVLSENDVQVDESNGLYEIVRTRSVNNNLSGLYRSEFF